MCKMTFAKEDHLKSKDQALFSHLSTILSSTKNFPKFSLPKIGTQQIILLLLSTETKNLSNLSMMSTETKKLFGQFTAFSTQEEPNFPHC